MSNNLYCTTDKLSDIICDNYSLLQVMSRFGLPLGFADNTVEEWCEANQVHGETFLAVVNFVAHPKEVSTDLAGISVPALMDYLKQSHHYFLDFQLPNIRRKLIEAIDCSAENEVAYLILKYFDSFVNEVRKHMDYEDMDVFQYVNSLLEGRKNPDYSISMFARDHDQVDAKLAELKNIIIKFYPPRGNGYVMNAVLFDIFTCEQELASHGQVEDGLFVPAVYQLEKRLDATKVCEVKKPLVEEPEEDTEMTGSQLSQREKEVICCVVKGMSNKEIAEALFISIHTVITHRRNIARKLQIHSSTLLTIYAIVNKLVDISEVKLNL